MLCEITGRRAHCRKKNVPRRILFNPSCWRRQLSGKRRRRKGNLRGKFERWWGKGARRKGESCWEERRECHDRGEVDFTIPYSYESSVWMCESVRPIIARAEMDWLASALRPLSAVFASLFLPCLFFKQTINMIRGFYRILLD